MYASVSMKKVLLLAFTVLLASCSEPQFAKKSSLFPKAVCEDLLWENDSNLDSVIHMMQDSGVTNIRLPVRWSMIETSKGIYNWVKLDSIVTKLTAAHISITAQFLSIPSWANGKTQDPSTPLDWADCYSPLNMEDYTDFLSEVVERYKNSIKEWILFNEVNLDYFWRPHANAAEYVSFLKAGYMVIKDIDSSILVIAGAFSGNGIENTEHYGNYLQDMYTHDASLYYDVLSIHPYTHPGKGISVLQTKIDQTKTFMAENQDHAALWIDELGWSVSPFAWNNPTLTDSERSQWLMKVYTELHGIDRVYWYCFKNKGIDYLNVEHNFGLIDYFHTPLGTYYAFKNLLSPKEM